MSNLNNLLNKLVNRTLSLQPTIDSRHPDVNDGSGRHLGLHRRLLAGLDVLLADRCTNLFYGAGFYDSYYNVCARDASLAVDA